MASGTLPSSFSRAIAQARANLLQFTQEWLAAAPAMPEAWFYRSYALELSGNYESRDTTNSATASLVKAYQLAPSADLRVRIEIAEVRVAIRQYHIAGAVALAESALVRNAAPTAHEAVLLAPLAAFAGDERRTVDLLHTAAGSDGERAALEPWMSVITPPWLGDSLRSFGVRAALGRCDSLDERRRSIEDGLAKTTAAIDLSAARRTLLPPIYRLAIMCLGPGVMQTIPAEIPFDQAARALARGDTLGARALMTPLSKARQGAAFAALAPDAVLVESYLYRAMGDTDLAKAHLRSGWSNLTAISASVLDQVTLAAALHRIAEDEAHLH